MRSILLISAAVALATTAYAQQGQNHAEHHPAGASAPSAVKKASPPAKRSDAKARRAAPAASATGMGAGMDPDKMKMHEEMHKPGGMHEQMHGKDGKAMGGPMTGRQRGAMPPAAAASS